MSEEKTIEFFKDIKDVLAYLGARGWKTSRNSIYRHVKEGKLCRNKEDVFEARAVNLYAKRNLQRLFEPYWDHLSSEEKEPHPDGSGDAENTLTDIKAVSIYLSSRGWLAPRQTLYRHITERKLKRNSKGRFEIISVEKYARKNLKCIDMKTPSSDETAHLFQTAMEKFFRDKAEKIISFVAGDAITADALKEFLTSEAGEYFRVDLTKKVTGETDE